MLPSVVGVVSEPGTATTAEKREALPVVPNSVLKSSTKVSAVVCVKAPTMLLKELSLMTPSSLEEPTCAVME